jgi:hypothetical protein
MRRDIAFYLAGLIVGAGGMCLLGLGLVRFCV